MVEAVKKADATCAPHKDAAARDGGTEATQGMREYMTVRLYRAKPVDETASIQPAEREKKNAAIVYAKGPTVACAWFDDIDKHYRLMEAGRPDMAVKLDCMPVDQGQKMVVLDKFDDTLTQVLYEARGFQRELWVKNWYIEH